MKTLISTVLLLSFLLAGNDLLAFQIQQLEEPEQPRMKLAVMPLRTNFPYNKAKDSVCYEITDSNKWSEFENELKSVLKKSGIYEGASLWSKGAQSRQLELPSLTKVKLNKIEIIVKMYVSSKTGTPYCEEVKTVLTTEVGGKEKVIELHPNYSHEEDRAYDVIQKFHTKNPAAKWSKKTISAIKEGKVFLGMTKAQATESWGKPDVVNRSVGSWGTKEQWVYGPKSYLYFTNDKLDSFQN